MPENRTPSPEKELLKLIEESKTEPATIKKTTFARQSRGIFSFGAWKGRFLFLKERLFNRKKTISVYEYDLRWLNRFLEFFLLVLTFYLVSSIFSSISNLKKIPSLTYKATLNKPVTDILEKSLLKKSVESYLEKVSQRDIFNMAEKEKPSTPSKPVAESISEALNNLKLVGISWSENPDAMIEDTKAMRTFFVKRGQTLGEFKVKAIYKDRVILSYGEQEFELK